MVLVCPIEELDNLARLEIFHPTLWVVLWSPPRSHVWKKRQFGRAPLEENEFWACQAGVRGEIVSNGHFLRSFDSEELACEEKRRKNEEAVV